MQKTLNISFKNKLQCVLSYSTKFELQIQLICEKEKRQGNGLHYWNRLGSKSNWISFRGLDNVDCSVNWTCQNGRSKMHVVIYLISTSASSVSNDVYRNTIDLHWCGHKNECLCERPDLYSFFPNKARILFEKCGSNFFESFKLAFKNFVPLISF